MYRENVEPRKVLWAIAEVGWQDSTGLPHWLPATLEDTSASGACIRVKSPISVGSNLTVKWQREQFSGVARNLRREGAEFLLGIQRDVASAVIETIWPLMASAPPSIAPQQVPLLPPIPVDKPSAPYASLAHATKAEVRPSEPQSPAPPDTLQSIGNLVDSVLELAAKNEVAVGRVPEQKEMQFKKEKTEILQRLTGSEERKQGAASAATESGPRILLAEGSEDERKVSFFANRLSQARSLPWPSSALLPAPAFAPSVPRSAPYPTQPHGGISIITPIDERRSTERRISRSAGVLQPEPRTERSSSRPERKLMPSKSFFSKLWPRHDDPTGAPDSIASSEVAVNKPENSAPVPVSATELLSCEEIYRASGLISANPDYSVSKIVDMLASKHIRGLASDVKRASVLMALDAAGTAVDHVLQDAARRQHALNSYETAQQKLFEEFEARKTRENAALQAELERLTANYSERMQRNLEHIAREKEAFQTWQSAKGQEYERITEAVVLCGKQPLTEPAGSKVVESAIAKPAENIASPTMPKPEEKAGEPVSAKPGETPAAQGAAASTTK